jgi:tight adherence protein C
VIVDAAPGIVWLLLAAAGFALGVFGARGAMEIALALGAAELVGLDEEPRWRIVRAFGGFLAGMPVWLATAHLGAGRWLAAIAVAGLAIVVAPRFLQGARDGVERALRDELPLHLDVIALAMDNGATLPGAIALCAEHAPDGPLRRAWERVLVDIHGGLDPVDALRAFEERLGFRLFGNLPAALRSAGKLGLEPAQMLREKSRHAAAQRFARAEQRARAAPLKLWATLMLCLVPCTLVVLAFPVAKMLALVAGV